MSEWKQIKLGEVISIKHGWAFKSEFFQEEITGKPIVVNIGNFKYKGGFRFEDTKTKEYLGDYPAEYALLPGDILLIMTCQTEVGEILGIPGIIPNDGKTYLHNQRLGKIIVKNDDLIDLGFLYWLLLTSDINQQLVGSASGTKIVHTSPARIESCDILIPPRPEQKAIAQILSSLDDKIDLLYRQNKTLEAIAETLFRQWFIEEAQADWEEGKLGDLADFNYGKTLRDQERSESGYPVIGSSGIVGFHKDFLVEAPGIVTGRKGTLGAINYLFDNFFPIDTTFYITSKIGSEGLFYEYFLLKSVGLGKMNSDSAVPGLNRNAAHVIPVIIPPDQLIKKFNDHSKPIFSKIKGSSGSVVETVFSDAFHAFRIREKPCLA